MKAEHLEFLVEEPSMEIFLAKLLPRVLNDQATFNIHVHQGKSDLLAKLESRLRGYAKWLPKIARIVILVDRDDDNCVTLKRRLEDAVKSAGLLTRATAHSAAWQVVTRMAVEELEAWFFSEWTAVRKAYPRVPAAIPNQAAYRQPDAIAGGTWEALERIMKGAGYFSGGLRKVEAANAIGEYFDPTNAKSPSFVSFREAIFEAVGVTL